MQGLFRTHYDNLQVSRTAPPEVITAAYRVLSRRYHPDMNGGNADAERIMRIVNASYAVLSDPRKRREHDQWIRDLEQRLSSAAETEKRTAQSQRPQGPVANHLSRFLVFYVLAGVVALGIYVESNPSPSKSGLPAYDPSPSVGISDSTSNGGSTTPVFQRPAKAPNGSAWPSTASYVRGYPLARADGLSKLTIDNSSNSSDMFVKLVALDPEKTLPIRHAFIPAFGSFTMNDIRAGQYDVRYMDMSDGSLSRSEEFRLEEISEPGGVRFSVTKMTLYKIANGNMQTYALNPSEF